MPISITYDDHGVTKALGRIPDQVRFAVDKALLRGALELGRAMRARAPKAFSTLVNSIRHDADGELAYRVGPHVQYARYVEEGRRPGGRMPPLLPIRQWLEVKGIRPNDPGMTQRDLAFVVARSIRDRGTPAQPFVAPFAEDVQWRLRIAELVDQGVDQGLRDAGLRT